MSPQPESVRSDLCSVDENCRCEGGTGEQAAGRRPSMWRSILFLYRVVLVLLTAGVGLHQLSWGLLRGQTWFKGKEWVVPSPQLRTSL